MKKVLFAILGLITIGLCDLTAQSKEIKLGDTVVIIERLSETEAEDRRIERIRVAQADNKVSESWRVGDFRFHDKTLRKDYDKLVSGFKKKGIKYKELTQDDFEAHSKSGDDKVVYLTTDYSIREEKKYLISIRTFKLLTADKKLLLDDSAKGILKRISGT
jgi:hypothetical protein